MLADVIAYQEQARVKRRTALNEMTRIAVEDGIADTADEFIDTRS